MKLSVRLYASSVVIGFAVSVLMMLGMWVTRLAFWFPPVWPGMWFSWLVIIICRGESWPEVVGRSLVILCNAAFYTWLSYRVIKAEVVSGGRFSRILLH